MNLGLIGKSLGHSFSPKYFSEKFKKLQISARYISYEMDALENLADFFEKHALTGVNVTIPYKKEAFHQLANCDVIAQEVGAINTIKKEGAQLVGYNTDVIGFKKSIENWLPSLQIKALVLGTGGASFAIQVALKQLRVPFQIVSRQKSETTISYAEVTNSLLSTHFLIINCTPLGTFPNTHQFPDFPYALITNQHYVYDLVYNPPITTFLKKAKNQGAHTKNGLEMLQLQAEASWEIWNR